MSPSPASLKAGSRSFMSIRSAGRMNSSSTARASGSIRAAGWPSRCRLPRGIAARHAGTGGSGWRIAEGPKALLEEQDKADYTACMLGLRDYVEKNRFPGVVLGLSGGIDSAICAALAADALGPERVHAVMLPYRYTSEDSLTDAKDCASALGIRYDILPIASAVEGLEAAVAPSSRARSAISRKKMCRAARAARSSCRSRTSLGRWS